MIQITRGQLDYFLIIGIIVFSCFYFVLRSIIWDSFVWILILPLICLIYVLYNYKRILSKKLIYIDKIIILYFIYGTSVTLFSFLFSADSNLELEVYAHYYLPSVVYFISRKYSSASINNINNLIKLSWLLSILFIIDIILEYIMYENNISTFIPWAYYDLPNITELTLDNFYNLGFGRLGTIFTSSKTAGMFLASLFCFIYPFMLGKLFDKNNNFSISLPTNRAIIILSIDRKSVV